MNLTEFLQKLKTGEIIDYLGNLDAEALMQNPWLLGGIAVVALIAFVTRQRLLLTTLFGVAAFTALLLFTVKRGTTLEAVFSQNLMMFVLVGVTILALIIYFLFIKTD